MIQACSWQNNIFLIISITYRNISKLVVKLFHYDPELTLSPQALVIRKASSFDKWRDSRKGEKNFLYLVALMPLITQCSSATTGASE